MEEVLEEVYEDSDIQPLPKAVVLRYLCLYIICEMRDS
jgi:hypothetical protein